MKEEGSEASLLLPNQPLPTNWRSGEYREAKLGSAREKREACLLAEEHVPCVMLAIAPFVYTVTHPCGHSLFFRQDRPSSRPNLCFL